ncbi:DUF262 domain-containing protein [Marinobacter mangrovi]|uniref:DUF262 domain-containing protein n=1 Tax=Marinobacter mangrovi TaxID=2803918 RepID=UPI001932ADAC|nr:DUF262 domain-containing protein [Marinobacter mangrovi]
MDRVDYQSIVIQDLINLQKSGELELSPWYQRRSVWNSAQKSYLINTLFENKPVPVIYVRHSLDLDREISVKEVVDGQQRSRTIIEYYEDGFRARHPGHDKKVLFSELKPAQRQDFLLTALPVGYLLGATDEDVIDIFGRINSISKTLNAQEKRNALYSGEMKQFCLKIASSKINFWRDYGVFSANDIARMNEVQFIADIAYNLMNGLSDFSASKLNKMYKDFDIEFPEAGQILDRIDNIFDTLVRVDAERIADTIFSRQPLLFSLMMVIDGKGGVEPQKLGAALARIDEIFNSPENKSEEDVEFYNASTSTTQRIKQRRIRDQYINKFL